MKAKIFIVGLPRTGTTSVCAALLEMGLSVAHTAFTKQAIESAQVIADAPVFNDYVQLHKLFPESRFVYLSRDETSWLGSIKILLTKVLSAINHSDGVMNPILLRCYRETFGPLNENVIADDDYLLDCYYRHQRAFYNYLETQNETCLSIDVAAECSLQTLAEYLSLEVDGGQKFPVLNGQGKITSWKDVRHPLKIDSNASGVDRRQYYQY